jgi:MerR family transcriptional regulator, thiopeptide resistance regulator
MDDHSGPRWRIGQVSARTGLTTRTLRYYEELGLLSPSERLAGGHRVYASEDLRRLYRVSLLRQLGLPLSDISRELDDSSRDLSDTIDRHIGQLDQRMAALGRHRERMITVRDSLASGSPTDEELLDILHEMAEIDHGLTQRLTLLVYDDIEAAHDHLVTVFGFWPGHDHSRRVWPGRTWRAACWRRCHLDASTIGCIPPGVACRHWRQHPLHGGHGR